MSLKSSVNKVFSNNRSVVKCVCFQRPLSLSTSGQGDQEVARVGSPATDYKVVVR